MGPGGRICTWQEEGKGGGSMGGSMGLQSPHGTLSHTFIPDRSTRWSNYRWWLTTIIVFGHTLQHDQIYLKHTPVISCDRNCLAINNASFQIHCQKIAVLSTSFFRCPENTMYLPLFDPHSYRNGITFPWYFHFNCVDYYWLSFRPELLMKLEDNWIRVLVAQNVLIICLTRNFDRMVWFSCLQNLNQILSDACIISSYQDTAGIKLHKWDRNIEKEEDLLFSRSKLTFYVFPKTMFLDSLKQNIECA